MSMTAATTPASGSKAVEQLGDDLGQAASGKAKKAEAETKLLLQFPPRQNDPSSCLPPLRDDQSTHASVANSCLQLCQIAGHGSHATVQDTTTVTSSTLFNDASYVKSVSSSLEALQECIQNHKDRRCRILACRTAGIVARSAYARVRHTPFLFAIRDPAVNRLEDEIGTDIPAALATAALDDDDDGVSASAVEALGTITLSSLAVPGNAVQDELLHQIQSIAFARVSAYAPTLRAVVDEDPVIPLAELQMRIQENVLSPRLLQLMDRIILYSDTAYKSAALPCLIACLVHQVRTTPAIMNCMDRTAFAKRWSEVDVGSLVGTAINALVVPLMQNDCDGAAARTAALSSLRLAHACPGAVWIPRVVRWAICVLREEMIEMNVTLENKLAAMAGLTIACRVLPLPERTPHLIGLAQQLVQLPPSTTAPFAATTPALMVRWQGWIGYKRPCRIGLWTEIALSFFLDGPDQTGRAEHLRTFLAGLLGNVPKDEEGLSPVKDEALLVFTTVAVEIGRGFRMTPDSNNLATVDWESAAAENWLQLSWIVLTSFVPCILTGPKSAYLDEDVSMITAGLTSYVQLLQDYLHSVGLLQPICSATFKLTTNACPPHVLWDRMMESAALLAKFEPVDKGVVESTTKLLDEMITRELRFGVPSHHMRLFILSLSADHWVQGRVIAMKNQSESTASGSNNTLTLNVASAKDIISALSPKRNLSKIIAAHVPPVSSDGRPKRDSMKKLAIETVRMCVACIENMALSAVEWKRRVGGSDAKQIISSAVGVLQGKGEEDVPDETILSLMTPICEAAIGRIQAQYESNSSGGSEFAMSELVIQPIKTKIKPLISSTKPAPVLNDVFQRGYWMQLCRQIIISKTSTAVYSYPKSESGTAGRATNLLRLTVPALSSSQDARTMSSFGNALEASNNWVKSCSTASDAAQIVAAATYKRHLRFDGEDEFHLSLNIRLFNMTAVDFTEGIRLELGATQLIPDEDTMSKYFADSLNTTLQALSQSGLPSFSASSFYRNEVKSGESLTWDVALTHEISKSSHPLELRPSLLHQKVPVESDDMDGKWVGPQAQGDKSAMGASTDEGESKSGEDDFQVTNDSINNPAASEIPETQSIRVACDSLTLPPMTGLQPCPLVFFRDCYGDYEVFRYLWFRMQLQLAPMKLERKATSGESGNGDAISRKIASMSQLKWSGEAIPGGFAAKAWAFLTASGDIVLCIYAESDSQGNNPGKQALYFRGQRQSSLYLLVGTGAVRRAVTAAMVPHLIPSN